MKELKSPSAPGKLCSDPSQTTESSASKNKTANLGANKPPNCHVGYRSMDALTYPLATFVDSQCQIESALNLPTTSFPKRRNQQPQTIKTTFIRQQQ